MALLSTERKSGLLNCITTLAIALLLSSACYAAALDNAKDDKIAPSLKERAKHMQSNEKVPVIILLDGKGQNMEGLSDIVTIKRRYQLINAVSGEATIQDLEGLENDPGVKRIYYDKVYEIPLVENPRIETKGINIEAVGAAYVQNSMGYTGKNVTIAIIDTGIDYTHPDLGGCIGTGCKVSDGFDFVNDDADPMDDDGHGTHCAGIAAANGGIPGVAPDAKLLAVKVCSPSGCRDSDTIAGIDWAVAHGAQVISLSLGSSIQPNDGYEPLQMICDAATEKGVTVVGAAGNEGPGSGTLSDVAASRKVISVGAADDQGTADTGDDAVASFSSRGPSAFGRFDPDIIAPGVGIYSTKLGGGYCTKTGTSMATPHAAGAAALLLEYDNSLKPEEIKSLLIHSAGDVEGNIFAKGAGLLNITRAIKAGAQAKINGRDAWEESIEPGMETTAILTIKNSHFYNIFFNATISTPTDSEDDYDISSQYMDFPSNVSVEAGSEKGFEIKFRADSGMAPGTYGAILSLVNADESIRIPVSLTIPITSPKKINGSTDNDCSTESPYTCGDLPSPDVNEWGDWRFYQIAYNNGTSLDLALNWSDSSNDLDLYLYAPNGVLAEVSGAGDTSGEHLRIENPEYQEYWAAVYAYHIVPSKLNYNLTVSYTPTVSIEPEQWQGVMRKGEQGLINFTLVNDATKNSNLQLKTITLKNGKGKSLSGLATRTDPNESRIVWKKSTSGLNLTDARYMNASLTWDDPSKDMDMYLYYYYDGAWYPTRFASLHRNDLLGTGEEALEYVDAGYYLKTYTDIGIGIENPGTSQSYTLRLNFTDESAADYLSISPGSISSLQVNASRALQVSINTSSLIAGCFYDSFIVIKEDQTEISRTPLRLTVAENTTTSSTTTTMTDLTTTTPTTNTTTTTSQGACTLAGDEPPCNEVTLSEVVSLINLWSAGNASLADVIALINAWAS